MIEHTRKANLSQRKMIWSKQRDIAAWSILIVGMLVTLWIWNVVQVDTFDDARTRFDSRAEQIKTAVAERMVAYEQILLGGVGLFESSPGPVTRSMWRTYVENLRIDKNYPGIQGVGFSLQINPEEKDDHVRRTREEGFPDYRVRPDGERDVYTSIIYLEPFFGRNLRAFGYDMFSEGVRRAAMERARDSGKVSISGKVILVQETGKDVQNGFLIYAPVYRKGMPAQTIEQRRAALLGYAYSPFRVNDFLQGIFHARTTDIDFEIYDGDGLDERRLIYDSDGVRAGGWKTLAGSEAPLFKATKTIAFQDQKWTLYFRSLPEFEVTIDRQKSNVILALGAIFSVLCFVVVHSAFTTRRKAVQLSEGMISALSTSENRLKSILDNTPAVVYMKQVDGRYILINRQWATLFKTTNEAMKEKLDSDFFPKDIADAFMANDKRVVEFGEPLIVEEVAPHDDGLHTYMSVKFPLRDGFGNIYGMAGISTDITERKQSEEETRKLSHAIEQSPISIVITDSNGNIEYVNNKFQELTGYTREEALGKNPRILKSGAQSKALYKGLWGKITSGETWRGELCNKKKNGHLFWERATISPIKNTDGKITHYVGLKEDITEHKLMEADLNKSDERWRLALEGTNDGLWDWNIKTGEVYFSPGWMTMLGYGPFELEGYVRSWKKLIHPDDMPHVMATLNLHLAGKTPYYATEYRVRTKSGGWKWILDRGKVFARDTNGEPLRAVGTHTDISARKSNEEEIQKLSHAIKQSLSPVMITSIRGDIEYVNPKFEEITGYSSVEAVGRKASLLKSGVHPPAFYRNLWKTILSGKEFRAEFCNRKKNGELFWELQSISPVFDAWGEIRNFISISIDDTERKKAEETLRKNEMELQVVRERLDLAIRGSYDGLWDWSTRESDPIWCSPIFYQMIGYEDGEFVMTLQKFIELIHEEDKARVVKAISDHLAQKSNDLYHVEFRLRTKLGDYRWYIARGQALWDANGNPTRFAGSMRDTTERKRIETELQQHREHLEELVELRTQQIAMENLDRRQAEERLARTLREQDTIFSTNPDIIYVADLQARLVKWNKSLETVTGYSPEEIAGKRCVSFFPLTETDLVTSAIRKVMSEGKGAVEAHLLCKSGALIPYHFNGVPLRNENGGIIGFTGTGCDITERKQAEDRLRKIYEQLIHSEKLSALGKLTGSIAHEFNNPIYGLRNIIEQTREEEGLGEEIKGLLDLAVRECDRMAGLVRKLQGFYKPSDDTRAVVDIHQLLDDIEVLTKKKLRVKGIELTKNYSPDLPGVSIVEDQIKQVLLNLINNAEEAIYGEHGKITIVTEVNGPNVKVHVQDTGEGIPEENLKLIFEPFFSTKGIKGTGLGLSVCYGIVHAHGGNIEVLSKSGEGSTFTLSLPIQGEA